jgi:hypothetical protein
VRIYLCHHRNSVTFSRLSAEAREPIQILAHRGLGSEGWQTESWVLFEFVVVRGIALKQIFEIGRLHLPDDDHPAKD